MAASGRPRGIDHIGLTVPDIDAAATRQASPAADRLSAADLALLSPHRRA